MRAHARLLCTPRRKKKRRQKERHSNNFNKLLPKKDPWGACWARGVTSHLARPPSVHWYHLTHRPGISASTAVLSLTPNLRLLPHTYIVQPRPHQDRLPQIQIISGARIWKSSTATYATSPAALPHRLCSQSSDATLFPPRLAHHNASGLRLHSVALTFRAQFVRISS